MSPIYFRPGDPVYCACEGLHYTSKKRLCKDSGEFCIAYPKRDGVRYASGLTGVLSYQKPDFR